MHAEMARTAASGRRETAIVIERGSEQAVCEEEFAQHTTKFHKFIVTDRLSKITCAEAGGAISIGGRIRRGNHEHRNAIEPVTGSNLTEYFKSINLGEVEIEQQKVRDRRARICFCCRKKVERALAVRRDVHLQGQIFHFDGFPNKQG